MTRPPRAAAWLLERVLPRGARDAAIGDLNEEFAAVVRDAGSAPARRWYWIQTFSLIRAFAAEGRRRPAALGEISVRRGGDTMTQDLRYALRALRRSPAFTLIAISVLAIGVGATSAIFSFVDGVLLRPLPYREPDRIVFLWERPPGGSRNVISTLTYLDWQQQNQVFESISAGTSASMTMAANGEVSQVRASRVSAGYFRVYGVATALGRAFSPGEDQPGKNNVVVLSYRFWQQRFGGDPGIVGRTIALDREPCVVIGVLPAGSPFDRGSSQLWRPLAFGPGELTRDYHWLRAIARLKPGITLEAARANMDAIAARISRDYPASNKDWGITIDRLPDVLVDPTLRRSLEVLLAGVGLLLVLGCTNLANLALARGTAREREVVVCAALGASRGRIVRQFLTESVLLSAAGGALGLASGYMMMRGLQLLLPSYYLPREAVIAMDWRAFAFAAGLAIGTGLLFGLAPAFHAGRVDLAGSMRASSRTATADRSRRRLRDILVIVEIAVSCLLLAGATLLVRSFLQMRGVDVARDPDRLLTAGLLTPDSRFSHPDQAREFFRTVLERVQGIPGVTAAALTAGLPLEGWPDGMPLRFAESNVRGGAGFKSISPSYFNTLGLPLLRGRGLTDQDRKGTTPVIVVNDAFAKRYFENQDPLGKHVLIQEIVPGQRRLGPEIPWQIVGVVANERTNGLSPQGSRGVYSSIEQSPMYGLSFVLRASGDPSFLVAPLKAAIHEIDPEQPVTDIRTVAAIKDEFVAPDRLRTWLFGVFSAIALLLAAVGIYGVMSYSVAQRTHEIGVRAALGASRGRIVGLVIRHAALLTGVGLAIGMAAAIAATRWMAALLFGVQPRDPVSLGAAALLLATVSLVAAYVPARRAARIDPIHALRVD